MNISSFSALYASQTWHGANDEWRKLVSNVMINSNTMHPASCPKWVLRETGKNEIFWSMNPKSFCGALRESFCWFSRGKIFTFKLKASVQYSSNLISFWGNEVEQSSSLSSKENLWEQAELTNSIYERKEFPSSELKYPRRFLGGFNKKPLISLSRPLLLEFTTRNLQNLLKHLKGGLYV